MGVEERIKAVEDYFDRQIRQSKDNWKHVEHMMYEDIMWEQRRYEIAKAAVANGNVYCFSEDSIEAQVDAQRTAKEAVAIADALVELLKGESDAKS